MATAAPQNVEAFNQYMMTAAEFFDPFIQKALLKEVPEIERFVARVGSDELGLDPMGTNETDGFVKLRPRDQWRHRDKTWVVDQIRAVTDRFPGVRQPREYSTTARNSCASGGS